MRCRHVLSRGLRCIVATGLSIGAFFGVPSGGAVLADDEGYEVVVVGDSITAMNEPQIAGSLDDAGISQVHFHALGARRIADSYEWHGWRSSGLEAIAAVRDAGVDPDLWLVELGTNDVLLAGMCGCRDRVEDAALLIDQVLDAIGPGETIVWVTVLNRDDPDSSDYFNAALRSRASVEPTMEVLDWHAAAVDHPDWFMDQVHPSQVGAGELAGLYIDAIDRAAGTASTRGWAPLRRV